MVSGSKLLKIRVIGYLAQDVLAEGSGGRVMGRTSRGIFLQSRGRWVTFLSSQGYRSPLTMVLDVDDGTLNGGVEIGMAVQFEPGRLIIPKIGMIISAEGSEVWYPQGVPASLRALKKRRECLAALGLEVSKIKPGVGLSGILGTLIHPAANQSAQRDEGRPRNAVDKLLLEENVRSIQDLLVQQDRNRLGDLISRCLGLGTGLTPSGDDFVIGLLLAMNRYQKALWRGGGLGRINEQVVEAAYQKTTTLSANMIELATWGEADERLLRTLDGIMGVGAISISQAAEDLAGWGNSSGVDTLVGMSAVMFQG